MKNICIENKLSSAIAGGVRLSDSELVFTTYQNVGSNVIRDHNLKRFGKVVEKLTKNQLTNLKS